MKGRPPSRNKGLRDGFYLEVFNKGASSGIKIRKETEAEMMEAVEEYRRENKTVNVLGPHKKGEWLNQVEADRAKAQRNKELKALQKAQAKKAAEVSLDDEQEEEFEEIDLSELKEEEPTGKAPKKEATSKKEAPAKKEKPAAAPKKTVAPAKEKAKAPAKEKAKAKPAPAAKKKVAAPAKKAKAPAPAKKKKK